MSWKKFHENPFPFGKDFVHSFFYLQKKFDIEALKRKNVFLKSKDNGLMNFKSKCTCKLPTDLQLLKKANDCEYYTAVTNLSLFQNLYDFIVPFIRKRWCRVSLNSERLQQQFCKLLKRMRPSRQIHRK